MIKASLAVKSFQHLGITSPLLDCLKANSIESPTPIQVHAIPSLLKPDAGHHFLAAQTGTGKTLAYALPLLQRLKAAEIDAGEMLTVPRNPRALVVVPNRELTIQANAVFSMFKHDIKLKVDSIYRGQTARVENKILDQGTDILISTPDRIDKHLLARRIGFKHLEHIVIDELDTLIDSGFRDFIEEYFKLREVANMTMVAATVPPYLDKFIDTHFSAPDSPEPDRPAITKVIESKTHTNLTNIAHEFIKLPEFNKMPTVLDVVRTINEDVGKGGGCMIFCNSIQSARALEHVFRESGIGSVSLHGDVLPKKRDANYRAFSERKVGYMICTDMASRGLDFPHVTHVLHFDFPRSLSDYLHRAGRTGRAGRNGVSICLYRNKQFDMIKELQDSYESNKPLAIKEASSLLQRKSDIHLRTQIGTGTTSKPKSQAKKQKKPFARSNKA